MDLLERLIARGIVPDLVTDQTSAHDELTGYVPRGAALAELERLRREDPKRYIARAYETMADHMRALLELQRRGAIVFDYGNNLRGQALKAGVERRVPRSAASCPSTSARSSARARGRSAGPRSPAIRRTSA